MIPQRSLEVSPTSPEPTEPSRSMLLDRRLRTLTADLGIDVTVSPLLSLLAFAAVVFVFAGRLGGTPVAIGAVAVVVMSPLFAERFAARRKSRRAVDALPAHCAALARSLRSGAPLAMALVELDVGGPCLEGLADIGGEIHNGRPVDDALDDWVTAASHDVERLLATALLLAERSGGDLAYCVDTVADSIRTELGALTRRRIVLAQSRTSARVLAALPIGFGAALSLFSDDPVYSGLVGVVSVSVGLALNAAGLYWMYVLTERIA